MFMLLMKFTQYKPERDKFVIRLQIAVCKFGLSHVKE